MAASTVAGAGAETHLDPSPATGSAVTTALLERQPDGWDALLASDPNAGPGHRPALWRAIAQTSSDVSLRFVAVLERGALLGGAPAITRRRAGLHWLHAMPFVLSGAPLARPGTHAVVDLEVGRGLARLQRELGIVGGEWAFYRPEGPPPSEAALGATSGETRLLETSVMDLRAGLEPVRRAAEPTVRHVLRQARATLAFAEEPEALEQAFALHAAQGRRWRSHRAIPLDLARRLLAVSDAAAPGVPAARLFTVRARGTLLGAMFYLDSPGEILAWWSGAREEARARHAMTFLYWATAEWAVAAGRRRLNLGSSPGLTGLAAFKRSLGAQSFGYPVRWLDARASPWGARALASLQDWARRRRYRGEAT